jgi:hypothetical protein
MRLAALALALAALGGCSKKAEPKPKPLPPIPDVEIQRDRDACKAYVDKVCACTSPGGQKQCPLARALPDALEIALGVAMNPSSEHAVALRAQVNVRETVKECIEETARLPALGCP